MKKQFEVVEINDEKISFNMLDKFTRKQKVKQRFSIKNGEELIEDVSFTDDWSIEKKHRIVDEYFINATANNGYNAGIYSDSDLIAFLSLDCNPIGEYNEYIQLTMLHVSEEFRNMGLGKILFQHAINKAEVMGVKKLYLSAHSAYESQLFYRNQGCIQAKWIYPIAKELEPYDVQMEYEL
ncbi:MAG: GNAT family N-acetyltransferase [Clostridiales bacterium]|nr:GNAT family N-acetyltransferase [Clostridiales bacterium]